MTTLSNNNLSALDVSSYFIKQGVTPLKLQKLLYYSQVWYFVRFNKILFNDKIKAWILGPVVYDVWDNFKYMKRSSIIPTSRAKDIDFDSAILAHLFDVWNSYGHLSGSDLVDLTHDDLPWLLARKGLLKDQPSGRDVDIDRLTTVDFKLDINGNIPVISPGSSFGRYSNSF